MVYTDVFVIGGSSVSIKWGRACPLFGLKATAMNLSLLFLAVAIAQTYGAIYDDVSQLPTHTYDYIVVGGTSFAPYMTRSDELIHDYR